MGVNAYVSANVEKSLFIKSVCSDNGQFLIFSTFLEKNHKEFTYLVLSLNVCLF
jgi:hypothetical protein